MSSSRTGQPLLRVVGLAHRFGRREVLRDLSLEVKPGEVFGLLGPNGSGKSTLLSILTGMLPRQRGELFFAGRPVRGNPRWVRRRLGVVFQEPSLDPLLSVRENLVMAGAIQGFGRSECIRRAELGLARAGLTDRGRDRVSTLSGGLKRRLDLARALVHGPELLIMDEPTSGLDEASFRATWQTLERMRSADGLTVIVATHRPEEAERCDRLAVLSGGHPVEIDSPDALRARVAPDVIALVGRDVAALARTIRERFGLETLIDEGSVLVECERGHELIPRLVEAIPAGRLDSVSLRRPTLADVFLKLTGHGLERDEDGPLTSKEAA